MNVIICFKIYVKLVMGGQVKLNYIIWIQFVLHKVTYEYKYQQNQSKLNYLTLLLYIILSDIYARYVDADP
jgi:hypothetical protein